MTTELILLIGLPASGKSSFYRARFADSHVLVSKDRFPNNKNRSRKQRNLIEDALRTGHPVVVDNTNPTRQERAELIQLALAFNARVVGYFFESRLTDCLERNRCRAGKARVPDVALYAISNKLQLPTVAEGFDQLFWVRLTEAGNFGVQFWVEAEANHEAG